MPGLGLEPRPMLMNTEPIGLGLLQLEVGALASASAFEEKKLVPDMPDMESTETATDYCPTCGECPDDDIRI